MIILPAIDIMGGRAVRLVKGEKNAVTVYGDPVEFAYKFKDAGAKYLHVVNLDGAFEGGVANADILKHVAEVKGLTAELGGGMRTVDRIAYAIEVLGFARVIVGSALVTDPDFAEHACARFGAAIVGGLDARDGKLALHGWVNSTDVTPLEVALRLKTLGVTDAVFTDISRDGTLCGANITATAALQRQSGLNIIASGGIGCAADLAAVKAAGIYGAIVGKAIYDKKIKIEEALSYAD